MSEAVQVALINGISAVVVGVLGVNGIKSYFKKKQMKLTSHPIFTRVEFNKSYVLTHFKLQNKGKEVVFREILFQHMDIYKKHCLKLATELEKKEVQAGNSTELYNLSVSALTDIVADLLFFYKNEVGLTNEEIRVLDIVMGKYNHWNEDRERLVLDRIQEACGSNFYQDNYTKSIFILDAFAFAMNDTIADANKTLNSINGDLRGLAFRGVVI